MSTQGNLLVYTHHRRAAVHHKSIKTTLVQKLNYVLVLPSKELWHSGQSYSVPGNARIP